MGDFDYITPIKYFVCFVLLCMASGVLTFAIGRGFGSGWYRAKHEEELARLREALQAQIEAESMED